MDCGFVGWVEGRDGFRRGRWSEVRVVELVKCFSGARCGGFLVEFSGGVAELTAINELLRFGDVVGGASGVGAGRCISSRFRNQLDPCVLVEHSDSTMEVSSACVASSAGGGEKHLR